MVDQITRWSLVRSAGRDHAGSRVALEELCRIYRPAVLAYLRRWGLDRDAAEDQTQSFFVHLLERDLAAKADPARGPFRLFLRTALRNHLSHQREHDQAQRRRAEGGQVAIDLVAEPASDANPERAFDLAWAMTVLERGVERLRADCKERGQADEFDRLRPALTEGLDGGELHSLARQLGVRPNTLSARLSRLRQRLRSAVREELSDTVDQAADVDEELRQLRDLMGA